MNAEELRAVIAEEVETALRRVLPEAIGSAMPSETCKDCCVKCDITGGQHRDDHAFVGDLRRNVRDGLHSAVSWVFRLLMVAVAAGVCAAIGIKFIR